MNANKMRKKIYCLERQRKDFDEIPYKKLKEMIGWVEPLENGTWDVNSIYEGEGSICEKQIAASILGHLQEIKALLIKLINNI